MVPHTHYHGPLCHVPGTWEQVLGHPAGFNKWTWYKPHMSADTQDTGWRFWLCL